MTSSIAILAATLAATFSAIVASTPASAGFLGKKQPTSASVELVSLQTQNNKLGWMQILSDDGAPAPKKRKKVKTDVNASPISRKLIPYDETIAVGTIVIDHSDRRLYHVIQKGMAMVYGVSVGREGFGWTGSEVVTAKAEWPAWNPPEEMRIREAKKGHILPERMEGGIDNPLGARAMYLGNTQYRIHGTNQPASIGRAMSSGCIRMANEDVEYLYAHVSIGTRVIVRR
ncbi:L,D-transpeptidase [Rhizobium sp. KVB221]|uniref:L,D-transpeptidase n=1 Tax=Rhizobium setariae TaxID=2801340 RepID=A0A937CQJ0_9HYPH|nr:L,D-transpeptidase [Rhizobium setariae]MBL0373087.1 L,D-transpeptidase [Rhizobium setariae]